VARKAPRRVGNAKSFYAIVGPKIRRHCECPMADPASRSGIAVRNGFAPAVAAALDTRVTNDGPRGTSTKP